MENKTGNKRKSMDVKTLNNIWAMTRKGVNATEISRFLDRDERSVQEYVKVLKAVHNNESINNHHRFRMAVIDEYCDLHSLQHPVIASSMPAEKKSKKSEQIQMDLSTPGTESLKKAVNMLNEIGISFHSLAEFLWENYCK